MPSPWLINLYRGLKLGVPGDIGYMGGMCLVGYRFVSGGVHRRLEANTLLEELIRHESTGEAAATDGSDAPAIFDENLRRRRRGQRIRKKAPPRESR